MKDQKVSKFLSFVLRHKPDSIGLTLDQNGWANIAELIQKSNLMLTKAIIEMAVRDNDKQRFAISSDGKYIRANQGHSINIDLDLKPVMPPITLYHGTAKRFMESIKLHGLTRQNRQHVHVSSSLETAIKVGRRHGSVVVLLIDSGKMHQDGYVYFQSENGVWLTKEIPGKYLKEMPII